MLKVDFRHDERKAVVEYLDANKALKAMTKDVAKKKQEVIDLFVNAGKAYKETEKTNYMAASVQINGVKRHAVYLHTTPKPSIDWEKYAKMLGGSESDAIAQGCTKENSATNTVKWATKAQELELGN